MERLSLPKSPDAPGGLSAMMRVLTRCPLPWSCRLGADLRQRRRQPARHVDLLEAAARRLRHALPKIRLRAAASSRQCAPWTSPHGPSSGHPLARAPMAAISPSRTRTSPEVVAKTTTTLVEFLSRSIAIARLVARFDEPARCHGPPRSRRWPSRFWPCPACPRSRKRGCRAVVTTDASMPSARRPTGHAGPCADRRSPRSASPRLVDQQVQLARPIPAARP